MMEHKQITFWLLLLAIVLAIFIVVAYRNNRAEKAKWQSWEDLTRRQLHTIATLKTE